VEGYFNERTRVALDDARAQTSREAVCRALASGLRECGAALWVGGYIVGGDRVQGRSPFGYGSDASVGLALVAQSGGELTSGAVGLLDQGNLYSAAALIRQAVEVEYLAWAFAEDEEEARRWLRSRREDRLKMWQPRHLRERSKGLFSASDYGDHCEEGGHPTPESRRLLPDHSDQRPPSFLWFELARHGVGAWEHIVSAVRRNGWLGTVGGLASVLALTDAIQAWRREDGLSVVIREGQGPDA
jgi:hypothetical protein